MHILCRIISTQPLLTTYYFQRDHRILCTSPTTHSTPTTTTSPLDNSTRSSGAYQSFTIPSPTTAKLSSPLLLPRTVSYDATSKPPRPNGSLRAMSGERAGRRRRSSSLLYQEPPETIEHMSDQAALPNLNANWVNAKGELEGSARSKRQA